MTGRLTKTLALGALTLALMGGTALAAEHAGKGHGGGQHKSGEMRAAKLEGRIAFLKAALNIKENQLTAWNAYAEGLRARKHQGHGARGSHGGGGRGSHGSGGGSHSGHGGESQTAVQKMDAQIQMMTTHIADLENMKPLTEALYAVLDDEQKKTANKVLVKKCC